MIDETHDRARQSWVASANGHAEFPLQNLPFGVFSPPGRTAPDASPRGGVAIGDMILDLRAALGAGLFSGEAERAAEAASGATLNPLMALGPEPRRALRRQVFALLAADGRAGQGRAARRHAAAPRRRLLAAPAGGDRQLHRFLRRHPPCHQWRPPARPEQPAQPELQIRPGRLSQPRLVGARIGRPGAPARTASARLPNEDGAELWPVPQSRLRTRTGGVDRPGQPRRASRSRSGRPATTFSASGSSTTGRRATSSIGRCRRSGRSSARISAAPCRRGSSPPRRWSRSGWRSRRGPHGDPRPLPYLWDDAGPAERRLRHRARSADADRADAREGAGAAPHVAQQHDRPLLDRGAARRAPHLRRLQPAARRHVRQRHDLRPDRAKATAASAS